MPTALDQRLASLWHRARIDLHADIERGVVAIERPHRRLLRGLLGLAGEPADDANSEADRLITATFWEVEDLIRTRFERVAKRAHRQAFGDFARTVPRKWFRALHPAYFVEKVVGEPAEPKPLSQAEWEAKLEQYSFPPPTEGDVLTFLDHHGPGGMRYYERLKSWDGHTRTSILEQLTQGFSAGEGLSDLRARLKPLVGGANYKAQRIARTEGRRVAELAQQRVLQQAGDLIGAQEIIATLDENTRPEHALRHGKRYERQQDGLFRADDGTYLPDLPDAPNCRCYASPVLATPEELLNDPAMAADFQNASADLIPDPAAYVNWFTAAEEPKRIAAVGVKRYRLAQKRLGRTPEWTDFLDRDGRLVPVARLRTESLADWEARRAGVEEVIRKREALLGRAAA